MQLPDLTGFAVPPWIKIAAVAMAAAALFAAGMRLEGKLKDSEIAEIHLEHARALAAAEQAKSAAEEKVRLAEDKAEKDLADLSEKYVKEQEYEKAAADRRIADLLSDNVRLRVSVQRPAGGCTLPGTASAAGGGDDQAGETLAPAVAGRLARRYADYNAIVGQLDTCQATIDKYLELSGPKAHP